MSDLSRELKVFNDHLSNSQSIKGVQTILALDSSGFNFFENLHKLFKKRLAEKGIDIPRILDTSNMLIPDISLIQNYRFFLELNKNDSSKINTNYNLLLNFKKFIHSKRGQIDEGIWQTFGLILYILSNSDISFISAPLAPALSSKKKSDLLFVTNELTQNKSIFFFASPPSIDMYKDACSNFRVLDNRNISDIMSYDEARECIMQTKRK